MTDLTLTQILSAIERGDEKPQTNCCRWIIRNFARLASTKLSKEQSGQSLQPTMLVHEAYLRLVDVAKPQEWQGRGPSLPPGRVLRFFGRIINWVMGSSVIWPLWAGVLRFPAALG